MMAISNKDRAHRAFIDAIIDEIRKMRIIQEKCDFCGKPENPDKLYPEEAGDFACEDCMKKWGEL